MGVQRLYRASAIEQVVWLMAVNRSGGIRTHDPHYPKVVRYRAALHAEEHKDTYLREIIR